MKRDVLHRKSVERIENLMELILSVENLVANNFSYKLNLWNVILCTENPAEHVNFQGNFCGTYRKL